MTLEPALRSLADALEAGVSLKALADDPALSTAWSVPVRAALKKSAAGALPLGDSLRQTRLLDDGPAAVIDAAERGGFLPKGLRLAADTIAAAQARRRRALAALAYPAFLVAAAGVILPLPVAFTSGARAYLRMAVPVELGLGLVLIVVFAIVPQLPASTRARLTLLSSRIPVAGAVIVEDARAAVLEILGALLAAGATLTMALPAAVRCAGLPSPTTTNARFSLARAEEVIARGGTLADALRAGGFVDETRAGRLAVAERSGTLDRILPELAKEASDTASRRFATLAIAAGLASFLLVAAAVGVAITRGMQSYAHAIDDATKE
jgi:general secretion pathway protein F